MTHSTRHAAEREGDPLPQGTKGRARHAAHSPLCLAATAPPALDPAWPPTPVPSVSPHQLPLQAAPTQTLLFILESALALNAPPLPKLLAAQEAWQKTSIV